MSASAGSNSSTAAAAPETIVVWGGEWPYVKRGVSEVRSATAGAARAVSGLFDVPGYLATARRYTSQVDSYVTAGTVNASAELQRHQWVVPATGITLASCFVVAKSIPWGGAAMMRNGMITAGALTVFMFPREIVAVVDSVLPFRTHTAAATDDAGAASE